MKKKNKHGIAFIARQLPAVRKERRQIAAAESYLATHSGCTLHNACVRSFGTAKGGYASGLSMYESLRQQRTGE